MSIQYRLFTEHWITEQTTDAEYILNYCRLKRQSINEVRYITFKLVDGTVSGFNLEFNNRKFNYFVTGPIKLPYELSWANIRQYPNGNVLQMIVKTKIRNSSTQ